MTTQPDHHYAAAPRPATLHELRTALSRYGLPGDRDLFEQDLAAALDSSPIGDLAAVAEVIATAGVRAVGPSHRRRVGPVDPGGGEVDGRQVGRAGRNGQRRHDGRVHGGTGLGLRRGLRLAGFGG
ncbi:hypothetical protein [Kitasatospora cathayae]|uniref:DUF1707 domain-containing protein n=1 Tax=Kitasatospora cathayae TaxID=3004092 RepID=A0ABY7QF53_9ACTN|nr:hypothetical protein [Kitasatospora sp. HUAS 3-15]WBP91358.1 hypothetical protein O1G21_39435 [Kitasatospora sp. HUAS 3-15]